MMSAQTLRTHQVDTNDSIETIAQQYGVLPDDILALNPDAKTQLNVGTILVIPHSMQKKTNETTKVKELVSYKVHRVKRKETLYSIAQKYNTTVKELKKHNQHLYANALQIKEKIYIPKYKTKTVAVPPKALKVYKVLPKEGKWRVAYKFGISVDELEALNPNMGVVLKEGQLLNVPNIDTEEEQEITDERFTFYKVLAKEGFYRLYKKIGAFARNFRTAQPWFG